MLNIALYKPDIPQNTAAIIRLGACYDIKVHIIEPCGFKLDDPRCKRVAMDYIKLSSIKRYADYEAFVKSNIKSRIILLTTKATRVYYNFKFKKNDILLFGRESAGVPNEIHKKVKDRLKVPMQKKARSLNIAMTAAIVASEAIRQFGIKE